MQKPMIDFDWNAVRSFHATATLGSLSAAAKHLNLTQPTLTRQVAALEAQLGLTLFDRVGKRLVLTETGQALLTHVQSMDEAASALSLAATGRSTVTDGVVSISASDVYATVVVPYVLPRIRAEYPNITVRIIASNSFSDLRRREADIAIRHARPQEPELIGKMLRESEANIYASTIWVQQHGMPKTKADLERAEWLGFDDTEQYASHLQRVGLNINASQFRILSSNGIVLWEMLKRGQGIGAMLREVAALTPDMVQLLPDLIPRTPVPLWLVTHRELRTSPRIRAVFDILGEELAKLGI
jgi:DNA-binding transcriptional LysR family regulator